LIRRHTHGDTISFSEISKHAFRLINGRGVYNYVDKITMTQTNNIDSNGIKNCGHWYDNGEKITI